MNVQSFTFNPFSENTYIVWDESLECIVLDPGCYEESERQELVSFIEKNKLNPKRLINSHCHIDHVFGNKFIANKYALKLEMNEKDLFNLHSLKKVSEMYNIPYDLSPEPEVFLDENSIIKFGNSSFEILFVPGHSPGSIAFYSKSDGFVIAGDVLFRQSIGRYDFPGGDYNTLMDSIRNKLFRLPDETIVYSGHGPQTTIGFEKANNPFMNP